MQEERSRLYHRGAFSGGSCGGHEIVSRSDGRRNDSVKKEGETEERRSEERFPGDFWAEAEQGGALYFQRVSNLSAGGCAFPQTVPQPVGTRLWLRFILPDAPHDEI